MPQTFTPRQIVQGLLQGIVPPRPLFLPIVFSQGARIENLSLRAFLTNPTKISNSLRQIRARLRSDGVTCYFDPLLEAEALGGVLRWDAQDRSPSVGWTRPAAKGALPEGLCSPEGAAQSGRVGVAAEVIRRLKSTLRDDCLPMASVTGPFTLAAVLTQLDGEQSLRLLDISRSAAELAAATISSIAKVFLEAGASVIFIREEVLPALSAEECADWASQLATTINIIRFYQALPVLCLTSKDSVAANREVIFGQQWDCVVCPVLDQEALDNSAPIPGSGTAGFGIALPPEALLQDESCTTMLDQRSVCGISNLRPAIITTTADMTAPEDVERLNKLWENVRR